jgi:hypothetical protein
VDKNATHFPKRLSLLKNWYEKIENDKIGKFITTSLNGILKLVMNLVANSISFKILCPVKDPNIQKDRQDFFRDRTFTFSSNSLLSTNITLAINKYSKHSERTYTFYMKRQSRFQFTCRQVMYTLWLKSRLCGPKKYPIAFQPFHFWSTIIYSTSPSFPKYSETCFFKTSSCFQKII